ncbi:MAG: ABC transporter permease subunit, partial [Lachnospiraceae bacterium]|nr:ABC transporter permease subunit [Lachnospiraceae bacterium]
LYVVLMLLPFQVMLLPQYLVLQQLHLYNHPAAVILPAVFSTFPVFIMYRGFTQIDPEIMEAARLDGAGEMQIFLYIGLPLGKMGIQAAMVLSFLEYWNLVEQPMAFLEEQSYWPLSLYLPQIEIGQAGFAFAVSVVVLIPALFVFALGQDALEEGIAYIGVKE